MTSIWLFSLAIPSRGSHGLGTHWDRPQLSILINPHLAGTTAGQSFPLLVQQLASPFPCWYNSWPVLSLATTNRGYNSWPVLSLAGTTAGQFFPLLVQQLASPFPCWYNSWHAVLSLAGTSAGQSIPLLVATNNRGTTAS